MKIKKEPRSAEIPEDVLFITEEEEGLIELIGEDLERYLSSNISLIRRELYVGDITYSEAMKFHKNIMMLDSISKAPITINIQSAGGICDAGNLMYNVIKNCNNKVIGICYGICASMAVTVLQACDDRILTPDMTFMIHEGSHTEGGADVHIRSAVSYGKETEYQIALGYHHLAERTGLTFDELEQLMSRADCYLTPQEAVTCGFADKILKLKKKFKPKKLDKKRVKRIIAKKAYNKIKEIR